MLAKTTGPAWGSIVVGLVLLGSAEAGTFRFEDEAGVVHYTNVPSDPRYHRAPGWPESQEGSPLTSATPLVARFAEAIRAAALRYGVDARLVEAVVLVESGGNPRAVSPKGAMGLMQLMPFRAAELGVYNSFDPGQNLDGGVRHLRDLLQRYEGDLTLALAAYNAGAEAVRWHGGVPPFRETQDYVRKIRALYRGGGTLGSLEKAPPGDGSRSEPIYEQVGEDGAVVYTNLPPNPTPLLKRRF